MCNRTLQENVVFMTLDNIYVRYSLIAMQSIGVQIKANIDTTFKNTFHIDRFKVIPPLIM